MYSSYLTRETFENEHDEKMTRKFSYNYQVLKRLFPEVYKLPESEIRSLVHSIYDNPKMGDELLDHLSDVINKKKPEWGEYLNPKPEEPEQTVQNNPLQPVQPKPLNTGSGFEAYKPQKSTFGLGNSGGFGNAGGLGNTSAFGLNNTNNFGTTGGLKQSQLPDFTKSMDLKHSDMVTGFGINEAKQKEMFGTGFSMPKLPKLPQFSKAPEPQIPELPQMPEISQALQVQPMQWYPQIQLANSAYNNQHSMPLVQQVQPEFSEDLVDKIYNHLKDADIEGYENFLYCDSLGNPTVGTGLLQSRKSDLYPYTIISYPGEITESNPAFTQEQKDALWDRQREFCNSFQYADSTWHVPFAENQIDRYLKRYGEYPPVFNEQELEAAAKHYIRTEVLPTIYKKMEEIAPGFFDTLGTKGKVALADMQYNMGSNFIIKKCTDPKCWKHFAEAVEARDVKAMAEACHRLQVNEKRNQKIYDYLLDAYSDL